MAGNGGSMSGDAGERDETTAPVTEARARGDATKPVSRRRRLLVRTLKVVVALVVAWLLLAYLILPALWRHYEHQPALENAPKTTRTAQGIPGDPLNVGLIGTEQEVVRAMLGSGWDAADPVTLKSSIGIARSVLRDQALHRCAGQPLVRVRAQARPRLREARGRERQPSSPRPVLEVHRVRAWRDAPVDRGGDV